MAITPDQFIETVKAEIQRYQDFPAPAQEGPIGGLISQKPLQPKGVYDRFLGQYLDEGKRGITALVEKIRIVDKSPRDGCKVLVGVEYPVESPSHDLNVIAANSKPFGVVQYQEGMSLVYATLQFDLSSGTVSDVEVRENEIADKIFGSRAVVKDLKGMPLAEAVEAFFSAIYHNRQMEKRA